MKTLTTTANFERLNTRLTLSGTEASSVIMQQVKGIPSSIRKSLNTPYFDSQLPNSTQKMTLAAYVFVSCDSCSEWMQGMVTESTLRNFVTQVEGNYPANPFHNFSHALDVLHGLSLNLRLIEANSFFTEACQFWLLVAALGHDLGHVGVTNQFLVETSHVLAVTYNDRSPLENMHCSQLFKVAADPEANIFSELTREAYKEMRKGIISAILHTDITKHNELVKELMLLYQMHSQAFESTEASEQVREVLGEHVQMIANAMLHCSDIGNQFKPWELAHKLAFLVLDEYFAQGDKEKELGIPVQILNDREKVTIATSQIGFSEFMLAPMIEAMVLLFPQLDELAMNLGKNIQKWQDTWEKETSPTQDAANKIQVRVNKVVAKCEALMRSEDDMFGD